MIGQPPGGGGPLGTKTDAETSCVLPSMPDFDSYSTRAANDDTFSIRRSTVAIVTADFRVPPPEPEKSPWRATPCMLDGPSCGGGAGGLAGDWQPLSSGAHSVMAASTAAALFLAVTTLPSTYH